MVGFFLNWTFSRMSLIKPLNPLCLYNPIKRYNKQASELGHHKEIEKERARSTAEQFKSVADEKLQVDKRGPETQASDGPEIESRIHHDPHSEYRKKPDRGDR